MNPGLVPAVTSAEVVILGGGLLVGRALELLLRSADCDVRFLCEPSSLGEQGPGEPGMLDGVRLLILAPGASAKCREAALAFIGARDAGARIEVLELVDHCRETLVGARNVLPWPCRTEDLKRRVMAALVDGPAPGCDDGQDGSGSQGPQKATEMVVGGRGID